MLKRIANRKLHLRIQAALGSGSDLSWVGRQHAASFDRAPIVGFFACE